MKKIALIGFSILINSSFVYANIIDSKYKYVNSEEGIPVYSSESSEESDICGWIKGGEYITVGKLTLKGFRKLESNINLPNCTGASYIQNGFLTSSVFAGPSSRTKVQKWKASVPNFDTQCKERHQTDKIIISFVGDVLLHGGLQIQGVQNGFDSLWTRATHVFQGADLAYANLEGPVAEDIDCEGRAEPGVTIGRRCYENPRYVYTSYPKFNYPPRLIPDLKNSGFDVVSTANNHALDRYGVGASKTISALEKNNFAYTGTRQNSNSAYYTITETYSQTGEKFRIAWLACTFSTNGIADSKSQVLDCYSNPASGKLNQQVLDIISSLDQSSQIDGVIVTPHWGPTEYVHTVHPAQMQLGKAMIKAGAIAVIGAHPHVLQPWEVVETSDGRQGLIHYSLGNFVSGQAQIARRASMILLLGFQKNYNNKLVIDGVKYIPSYMQVLGKTDRRYTPLDRGSKMSSEGISALDNIFSIFPESLRHDSYDNLSTCQ